MFWTSAPLFTPTMLIAVRTRMPTTPDELRGAGRQRDQAAEIDRKRGGERRDRAGGGDAEEHPAAEKPEQRGRRRARCRCRCRRRAGIAAPSSASESAPSSDSAPPTPRPRASRGAECTARAISAGTRKIPEPMIVPMTRFTVSNSVRSRRSSVIGGLLQLSSAGVCGNSIFKRRPSGAGASPAHAVAGAALATEPASIPPKKRPPDRRRPVRKVGRVDP